MTLISLSPEKIQEIKSLYKKNIFGFIRLGKLFNLKPRKIRYIIEYQ